MEILKESEDNLDDVKMEYGDCLVCLILTRELGNRKYDLVSLSEVIHHLIGFDVVDNLYLNLNECLELALNKIESRKGKIVNGVWVKEK